MEQRKFKLSCSGIIAKKDLSSSTISDENVDPRLKIPLSERKPLQETCAVGEKQTGRSAKESMKPNSVSPQPSDLLLQLDDSKEDESVRTNEDTSLSLDNQEFYERNCPKRRLISRLDEPYERERKMSQSTTEFMRKSMEIQKELWERKQDDSEQKSLYEGSIIQALSPHFPSGVQSQFLKLSETNGQNRLFGQVNECLLQLGLKPLEAAQAEDPQLLLQLLLDTMKSAPQPLTCTKEVQLTGEEIPVFQQLFARKAQGCANDQAVLSAIGYFQTLIQMREEEVKDLQRKLEGQVRSCKALERDSKKTAKLFSDKMALLEKTNAELRNELVEMKFELDRAAEVNLESTRPRSKSPLRSISSNEASAVLQEICHILAIKHPHHILKSVTKLEKVVRAVPKLERFIREVCGFIYPSLKDDGLKREYAADVDFLSKRLREWSAELTSLRAFKGSVCHYLSARPQTSDEELLNLLGEREIDEFEQHFRQVFELKESQDAFEVASQLFLQNHELRAFSRSVKQFLGVGEESSLSSVLLLIKQLKRR
jgi:hypothetical protein